jgi:hypothetical protein
MDFETAPIHFCDKLARTMRTLGWCPDAIASHARNVLLGRPGWTVVCFDVAVDSVGLVAFLAQDGKTISVEMLDPAWEQHALANPDGSDWEDDEDEEYPPPGSV